MLTAEDEADAEDGEAEVGETRATGRADEVLADERVIEVNDEVEEVEEAEASDAEETTLGQKVLLKACISVGDHCQH